MSAHSQMRRTFLIAFVLLAVSAGSAIASAAGSTQAHRKTSAHKPTSSRTSSHAGVKRTRSRKYTSAPVRAVRYSPGRSTTSPRPSGANAAYSIGYRNGYDAGRVAALKEFESQSADANLGTRPSQAVPPANNATSQRPAAPATAAAAPRPAASGQTSPTVRPAAIPANDASVPEPSDADPVAGPVNTSQSAQYKPGSSSKQNNHNTADDDEEPYETATLEMPRAGMPISLRGSLASLERQNSRLESEGLERILDEDDLNSRIAHGLLAPLPVSSNLTVNPSLPENRRYCRSWTARFLSDLAKSHAAAFHRPFQVNSAVRTVDYQKHLMRTNGNAAAAEGDVVSPHLTGATIDIGKQGMTRSELVWMRRQLLALQNAGKIDVEEEFEQACFHITVYKTYETTRPAHKTAPPAMRDAFAPKTTPAPAPRRGSSLPTSIAVGTFAPQGR